MKLSEAIIFLEAIAQLLETKEPDYLGNNSAYGGYSDAIDTIREEAERLKRKAKRVKEA